MTVELCASSRNAVPVDQASDVTSLVSVYVKGSGGHPIDVICVLDTSGSMVGTMDLVKDCMKRTITKLGGDDRLAIVSFASRAQVQLPLTAMDSAGRKAAEGMINRVQANGGTDIDGALRKTFSVVADSTPHKAVAAVVIFLTDGLPTSGSIKDRQGLLTLARDCFQRSKDSHYKSVSLFPLGFGTSHDAHFLYELANYGKGCYSYMSSEEEIAMNLDACFKFSTNIVACDMELTITTEGDCTVEKVHTRYDTNGTTVMLSDINTNQERHILVDLTVPKEVDTEATTAATAHLSYYDVEKGAYQDVTLPVVIPRNTCTAVDPQVEVHKMRLLVAYALKKASTLCEEGEVAKAANLIHGANNAINGSTVKDDEECKGLLEDLKMCEQGLQHASGLLSVASNVSYGKVGTAKHHTTGYQATKHSAPTRYNPGMHPAANKDMELTAMYVTPSLVISHDGEGYRVLRKSTSKVGKHGAAKILFEACNIKTNKVESIVVPASSVVTLHNMKKPKETFSRESPCVVCNNSDGSLEVMHYRTCLHKTCLQCFNDMPECVICN